MKTSTAVEAAAIAAVVVALQLGTLVRAVAEPLGMAVHDAELSALRSRTAPHRPHFREVIEVLGTTHGRTL